MKKVILLIIVTMFLAMGTSAQRFEWMDNFDVFKNYPYNSWPSDGTKTLPAPWEDTINMYAHAGIGHNATAGVSGPVRGWSWGHVFRPLDNTARVEDAMVARIFLPARTNYEGVMLALTTDKTPGASGQFAGGAGAVIHIASGKDKALANISFWCADPSGKRQGSIKAAPHSFLPTGEWYDLRLILGMDRTVALEYRHVMMSYWIPVGILSVHENFRPNYIAISATRGGIIDDVGYTITRKTKEDNYE